MAGTQALSSGRSDDPLLMDIMDSAGGEACSDACSTPDHCSSSRVGGGVINYQQAGQWSKPKLGLDEAEAEPFGGLAPTNRMV